MTTPKPKVLAAIDPGTPERVTVTVDEVMRMAQQYRLANLNTITNRFDSLRTAVEQLVAERDALRERAEKTERCAIGYSDIISNHCIAMQSALIDAELRSLSAGIHWIHNTLYGPGLIPDYAEARELGGAQAWFDRETAKHEEFRRQHPAPAALKGKP